ncbi:MAG: bifunctional methylenetetrahydrofolate dehydrogenase/methenyltetrahydrofolate cyclohydrolase FolD [Nanoarchaeota archaeon]|nr:bifunctional methylenetetrahydrofolate dehydrogenase/methenyltetrahydrofolate cyclohydrolase FolD [Nanoarchaeota archaeon]
MAIILDGKKIAEKIKLELKEKISRLDKKPCLAVVLVGDDPSSKVYVSMKQIACEGVGIISKEYHFSTDVKEEELVNLLKKLNADSNINGILVQLPLPKHMDEYEIIKTVSPLKDVDGFHPINIGRFSWGRKKLIPCTPKGILRLLKEYNIKMEGKDAVVVGRSNVVGKPIALLLMENNATVTVCHSKTNNLKEKTSKADILIVATGVPKLIKKNMVRGGAVVVDVGVSRIEDLTKKKGYYLSGDVDFEEVKESVSYISPVPGGVGPMTVAMLMENTLEAYKSQNGE